MELLSSRGEDGFLKAAGDAIDATPRDTVLIGQREALLRQADIEEVLQ
jgi:hypothetical protein